LYLNCIPIIIPAVSKTPGVDCSLKRRLDGTKLMSAERAYEVIGSLPSRGGAAMAIIAISRQMGSGGYTIAAAVAKAMNYEYVDREIIMRAAIVRHPETRHLFFEATADNGHVSLKGVVRQPGVREEIAKAASAVPGVVSVTCEQITTAFYPGPAV